MGVTIQRRRQHAADLPGLAVRQQLQRVRPLLAGQIRPTAQFRNREQDINLLKVRNSQGDMVPLEHAGRICAT